MSTPAPAPVMAPMPPPPMMSQSTATQNVTYVVYQMPAPTASGAEIKMNWSACCSFYFARTVLTLLLWACWVIYIAGVSKNQQTCNNGGMMAITPASNGVPVINAPFPDVVALSQLSANAVPNSSSSCVYYFGLIWWSIWLQFTTCIFVTITTFQIFAKFPGVKGIFTTALYFTIMSSVLMFFMANIYNNAVYVNMNKLSYPNNDWTSGCTLVLVGTITSLIINFIYLIWNSYADVPALPGVPAHMPAPHTAPTPTVEATVTPEGAKATAA